MNQYDIYKISCQGGENIYIKRDDLIPYSFGGNKARKAKIFFNEIDEGNYDCVVTYGSSRSNHCRVIANMAAGRGIECQIISSEETSERSFNLLLMQLFGAKITLCPVAKVHETIEKMMSDLKKQGRKPYFIPGGGHGNLGTRAYVECYHEIKQFEEEKNLKFDYIFHASGTGTTQAGLVCGGLLDDNPVKVVGISIARKNPYGRDIIVRSVKDYLEDCHKMISEEVIEKAVEFDDSHIQNGYGKSSEPVWNLIKYMMVTHGIPMDTTYVGKAFMGMIDYIKKNRISDKKILFIHTGGTPLFFNDLESR